MIISKLRHRVILAAVLAAFASAAFTGCGTADKADKAAGEKTFVYGTADYGVANENAGLDPHDTYCGWSTVRYGVGETLFKFNEQMEPEPWLAKGYERLDDYTVKIELRDDVKFSNGKPLTGESVKRCFIDLLTRHDRAPEDLQIDSIVADGQFVTIKTREKAPALINYLCDPYGAIVDVEAGFADRMAIGTGPYIAVSVTDTEVQLVKNPDYWNGTPHVDKIVVRRIIDGDTLTMAMQSGELDAAQGLPYASLPLFEGKKEYQISSSNTSRVYQAAFNFKTPALQDVRVRQAIAMAIDKEGFANVLLNGNGTPAVGPFPSNLPFGGAAVQGPAYDKAAARELLAQAGWTDTDGDGLVDKAGQNMQLNWLTYTFRQELPLFAESAQASLKDIGIQVNINATDNYRDFLRSGEYDIYAKAFVTAPTGDPEYYFTTHILSTSAYNDGFYHSAPAEELAQQLHNTFNKEERSALAVRLQQRLLDDAAFIYGAHLKMSLVMKSNVTGFAAHPSDYYEVTSDLAIE